MRTSYQTSYNSNLLKGSQKRDQNGFRESLYNESRENIYNRQKDLHNDIEIDVPELIDREETQPGEEGGIEDSFNHRNESNVSAQIINEYKTDQFTGNHKRSLSKPTAKLDQQGQSSLSKSTLGPAKIRRRIEDLYKWQERINKKQEVQREFQEQIKDSMYGYKIYTNELSNRLVQNKRPSVGVEDWLISQGKAREARRKKLENDVYGKERVPSITRKGHSVQRDQSVHLRLYDLDRSRRERSRDAMTRSQADSFDMKRSRSKDSILRKKSLYTVLGSPPSNARNVDFFFSPKDMISPIEVENKANKNINKDLQLSSQGSSVFSPTSTFQSPFPSVKNSEAIRKHNNGYISAERNRDALFESDVTLPAARIDRRATEGAKTAPMNIYKRLAPTTKTSNSQQINQQITRAQTDSQVPDQNKREDSHRSQNQTGTQKVNYDNSLALRRKVLSSNVQTESAPILPNVLQLKNSERPTSMAANYSTQDRENAIRDMLVNRPDDFSKETADLKVMEAFWDQILQDDYENRGRRDNKDVNKSNSQRDYSNNEQPYQSRVDFNERSRQWMDKKNKKIVDQRKQKEDQELDGCTFKPYFFTNVKSPKSNELLYQNFLHRMNNKHNNSINASSDPYLPTKKNVFSAGQTMTDFKSTNSENVGNHSANRGGAGLSEDHELQRKLYHYILDSNNAK